MSKYIAEFVGTFIFVSVILFSVRALTKSNTTFIIPFAVAIGLLAGIFVCIGAGGDAHLNPAVSAAFLAKGDLTTKMFAENVASQIGGALLAFLAYKFITKA